MRLALLADVHGNPIALEAVVRDVRERGGVDGFWVLGDLAALGYDPAGALESLAALPNVRMVRGNTDRYKVTGERPGDTPTVASAQTRPEQVPQLLEVDRAFTWAQGHLAARGWLEWLGGLPVEERLQLPDGTRMLGVHAAPGNDDGRGLQDDAEDDEIAAAIEGCEADLIFAGHTHRPMDRWVEGTRVVNVGCVSNPPLKDGRASYALVEANETGHGVELRKVAYDCGAVREAIRRSGYPGGADTWLLRHFVDRPAAVQGESDR